MRELGSAYIHTHVQGLTGMHRAVRKTGRYTSLYSRAPNFTSHFSYAQLTPLSVYVHWNLLEDTEETSRPAATQCTFMHTLFFLPSSEFCRRARLRIPEEVMAPRGSRYIPARRMGLETFTQ